MRIEGEIAIETRTTARGRVASHLVVSLDCLANILMSESSVIDPDDVARLLVVICQSAVDAGHADRDVAAKCRDQYQADIKD